MKQLPGLKPRTRYQSAIRILVPIAGLWFGLDLSARLGAELFWFQEVGYLKMYLLRLTTQGVLWIVTFALSLGYLLGNLGLAQRLKYAPPPDYLPLARPSKPAIRFRWLMSLTLGLSLLVGMLLLYYGLALFSQWHPAPNLPTVSPPMPSLFRPESLWHLGVRSVSQGWIAIALLGLAIALLRSPQFWLVAISLVLSGLVSSVLSRQWVRVLQSLHAASFDRTEPVFNKDIGFYIFSLPLWELLEFWLMGLLLYGWMAVALTYLLSGNSISQGWFVGFSPPQRRHPLRAGGRLFVSSRLQLLAQPLPIAVLSPRGC
ncbi:MAG: COG1615 family transporter, partial [Acaryochloridaceae cyanobacterium RU_4_10]|nr:COG1615 family transporter [Acaryochloridaceae cyanobacterium RU_4_10]